MRRRLICNVDPRTTFYTQHINVTDFNVTAFIHFDPEVGSTYFVPNVSNIAHYQDHRNTLRFVYVTCITDFKYLPPLKTRVLCWLYQK